MHSYLIRIQNIENFIATERDPTKRMLYKRVLRTMEQEFMRMMEERREEVYG
jgi:hypothetical protein